MHQIQQPSCSELGCLWERSSSLLGGDADVADPLDRVECRHPTHHLPSSQHPQRFPADVAVARVPAPRPFVVRCEAHLPRDVELKLVQPVHRPLYHHHQLLLAVPNPQHTLLYCHLAADLVKLTDAEDVRRQPLNEVHTHEGATTSVLPG